LRHLGEVRGHDEGQADIFLPDAVLHHLHQVEQLQKTNRFKIREVALD
jgi:hypothetical protein